MDDPLAEFEPSLQNITDHGYPENWEFIGKKKGRSRNLATSKKADMYSIKSYDIYKDEFGKTVISPITFVTPAAMCLVSKLNIIGE